MMGPMSAQTTQEVRDAPERSRYELVVDGEVAGFADYTLDGEVMAISHVEVDLDRQGQSLGSVLVSRALDDLRRRGLSVVPQCPFVRTYISGHDQYADLLAPGS